MVGAQRPVERERAARGTEPVDEHRRLAQRRLAVRALARVRRAERRADAGVGQRPVLEYEALLRARLRRPREELAGTLVERTCLAGRERRRGAGLFGRADHAAAARAGQCAAASSDRCIGLLRTLVGA